MSLRQFYYNNKLYLTMFVLFIINGILFFSLGTKYAKLNGESSTRSQNVQKYEKLSIEDQRNKDLIVAKSAFAPHFNFLGHGIEYSKYVSKSFKENGLWESPQSGFIEDLFKNVAPKDAVFIEVGANIGWFTMLVANTGHFTYAIEGYKYNLEILRANMILNPQFSSNVKIIPKAVMGPDYPTDKLCLIPYFSSNRENEDNAQPNPLNTKCDHPSGELVEVSTIDRELININKRPFLMNFDVEGYEFEALKGADKFLKKFNPCYIIVDVDHLAVAKTDSETITKWLKGRGYDLCLHSVDRDKLYQHNTCTMYSSKLIECESYA